MRLSGKTVIEYPLPQGISTPSDFYLPEVQATVRDKGTTVIFQKAYLCACKSQESDSLNICKNCGGVGYLFANPIKTQMIFSGLKYNRRFQDYGAQDSGLVSVTALNEQKFSFMDMLVLKNLTAEHQQVLYPKLTDDGNTLFAFTKYDVISVDFLGLFVSATQKLQRLTEANGDFSFRDNVITFNSSFNNLDTPGVTIRYVHHPVYHIMDISRESFTSTQGSLNQGKEKLILPIHAIAQRAHLIKEVENFDGTRLLDNSWLPLPCVESEITAFNRQLKYSTAQDIFDNLTAAQIIALGDLIGTDSMKLIKVSTTSAEILQLFTVPKELVPAPGIGKYIQVLGVTLRYNFGTIAYNNTGGHRISINSNDLCFFFALGQPNSFIESEPVIGVGNSSLENKSIVMTTNANPIDGDGTLDVYISYEIIDL